MIFFKKNNLIRFIILILSLSILNGFNKTNIYLPKIPIHMKIGEVTQTYQTIGKNPYFSQKLNQKIEKYPNCYNFTGKNDKPFYTISIDNTKNRYKGSTDVGRVFYTLGGGITGFVVGGIGGVAAGFYVQLGAVLFPDDSTNYMREGAKNGSVAGAIVGMIGTNIVLSLDSSRTVSTYTVKCNETKKSFIKKQRKGSILFDPTVRYYIPLANHKLSWEKIIKILPNANTQLNYIELFDEVEEYNKSKPNFNSIDAWKKKELVKYNNKLKKYGKPKGEFEPTQKYVDRIESERKIVKEINQKIAEINQNHQIKSDSIRNKFNKKSKIEFDALNKKIGKIELDKFHKINLSDYNADEQTFTVTSPTHFLKKKIKVNLKDAENFKQKYLNSLIIKQKIKPVISTESQSSTGWQEGEETILINLKTNKHIPFLTQNSIFKYSIEEER